MAKESKIKTTIVSYDEFSDYLFQPPATFYILNAMAEYIFYHTSSRAKAQSAVDEEYGKGRYPVKASKMQATKCRSESGELTCR